MFLMEYNIYIKEGYIPFQKYAPLFLIGCGERI
jgi:hypothetical protein